MPSSLSPSFDPALLQPNEASLRRSGSGSSSTAGNSRLSHAAVEFESVLLGQWLQSAQKSFATVPGSEEDEDAGGDQMLGFATQQLAQSIARSGGLGIARIVEHALEKSAGVPGTRPTQGNDTEGP